MRTIFLKVNELLRSKLTRAQYLILIAVVIGLISGLIAVLLKTLVHYLQHWIESIPVSKFSYLLFPALGLIGTVYLVRRLFGARFERGIAMVLKSIAGRSSFIPRVHTYGHVATSSVTVGLGGSVGLEAPIVATGSAIGSNVSRVMDLAYPERTLMVACGAAAGIAAVFNAPIAGVIFAIEVLMTEMMVSHFIPLIISAVVGALVSRIILQEGLLFNFILKRDFDYSNVPFYILLGVLAGFMSLYYARVFKRVEHTLAGMHMNAYVRAVIAGLVLMVIYFVFPPLYGEGYNVVKLVANNSFDNFADNTTVFSKIGEGWGVVIFAILIVLFKPVAAGITIGGGGNGGNFAPSLFTGAFLGFFFSKIINLADWVKLPVGNFSLVGMAGMLSGVMYCPLTGIFLIAEITNGYGLFIPLMIVSSISFFIVKSSEPFSLEIKKLAQEGQIFTHKKEKNILTAIRMSDMLGENYPNIHLNKTLRDLIELIKTSEKNVFAVHDDNGQFAGLIELNDIKQKLFRPEEFGHLPIRSLVKRPAAILHVNDSMHTVMEKFDITQSWYLPVLTQDKRLAGFISKTKLFAKYREILSSQNDLMSDV